MSAPSLFSIIGYVGEVSAPNGPAVKGYFLDRWGAEAQADFERWLERYTERQLQTQADRTHAENTNLRLCIKALQRRLNELEQPRPEPIGHQPNTDTATATACAGGVAITLPGARAVAVQIDSLPAAKALAYSILAATAEIERQQEA